MAKRGRKRKSGKREPNGRPQRGEDIKTLAARMPHRASVVYFDEYKKTTSGVKRIVTGAYIPHGELHNEKAESPLGRLRLVDAISEEQYLAGRQFSSDVAKYRTILGCKGPPQSIAGFGQPNAGGAAEIDEDRAARIRDNYNAAFAAIGSRVGQACIKHVVIQENELDALMFQYLHIALRNLVAHYGLTT